MMPERLFDDALEYHKKGQLVKAQELYEEILKIQPGNADALHLLGVIAYQTNNQQHAVDLIDKAIAIYPHNAAYHSNRGVALKELKQWESAISSYDQAIALKPDYVDVWYNRGNALMELRRWEEAIASYDKAIAIKPIFAGAWSNRGVALQELKQLDEAIASYDQAIVLDPDHAEAWFNRGNALQELKRPEEAVSNYDQAISLKIEHAEVWTNRGNALMELEQINAAITSYDRAIAINPEYVKAWSNRGNALLVSEKKEEAVSNYDHAIALDPEYAEAWYNRGNALQELKRPEEAVSSYDKAIAIRAQHSEAWYNRGNALMNLKRWSAAVNSYDRAVAVNPEYVEAWSNRGNALMEFEHLDEAVSSYDRALAVKPEYAEAWFNRSNVLKDLKEWRAATESIVKAFSINPDIDYLTGSYLHLLMTICDWTSFDDLLNRMVTKIENDERAATPFPALGLIDSLSIIKQATASYVAGRYSSLSGLQGLVKRQKNEKIRIGYYSADYHDHATMRLMAELFEKHDRSKFEIIAFSFGPDPVDDVMRKRAVSAFDRFIDVRTKSDKEVAGLSRELEIDIAVDLKGFTKDARTGIFSYRAAPIQVNYLGYPATMCTEFIDYLIADPVLVPVEYQQFYTEKIVYLPNSYQVNDAKRESADKVFTREELGLPKTGFVFCCFNNNYKITPLTFDCWMRLLERVGGSVLWLLEDNPQVSKNLRTEAERRGVDADRLVFASRIPLLEHLARHRSADLFLDTLPYNAHTTASDALWAGLPVLTCIGESFAGRVAASLLNAVQLPELITYSQLEYEALAIDLATDPKKISRIRRKLEKNRMTAPLFDSDLFTKHIEAAYMEMYERYQLDLPADHIYVNS
jgi:predicted O-linked N-acetylglucosamine transferase (SPINDLY family)